MRFWKVVATHVVRGDSDCASWTRGLAPCFTPPYTKDACCFGTAGCFDTQLYRHSECCDTGYARFAAPAQTLTQAEWEQEISAALKNVSWQGLSLDLYKTNTVPSGPDLPTIVPDKVFWVANKRGSKFQGSNSNSRELELTK